LVMRLLFSRSSLAWHTLSALAANGVVRDLPECADCRPHSWRQSIHPLVWCGSEMGPCLMIICSKWGHDDWQWKSGPLLLAHVCHTLIRHDKRKQTPVANECGLTPLGSTSPVHCLLFFDLSLLELDDTEASFWKRLYDGDVLRLWLSSIGRHEHLFIRIYILAGLHCSLSQAILMWKGCLQSGRRAETQFIQVAYLQVAIELIACAWSGLPLRLSPFDSHDVNYCTAGRNFCFGKVESSWKCWPRADKLKGPVHTRKVSIPNPKEGIQKVHGNSQLWVDRLLDSTAFSSVPFKGVTRKRSSLKASVKKYDC